MRTLREIGKEHGANKKEEGSHYYEIYEKHFNPIRKEPLHVLEIGVQSGGSLHMWHEYFPKAQILGIDILEKCRKHAAGRIEVIIGDQSDRDFLRNVAEKYSFDIVIDDGAHTMKAQLKSLSELWSTVKPGGFYVIEDLHTSYWPQFNGAIHSEKTTVAFLKRCIDSINWYAWKRSFRAEPYRRKEGITYLEETLHGLHVYKSIAFLEKA